MFGDYTRSTPNKLIFTPGSDYVLEARNTSGITTSVYSSSRQWGTVASSSNIADPFGEFLVLAVPGGAQTGLTTHFDVSANIKSKLVSGTYTNGQSLGRFSNKSVTSNNGATVSSVQSKFYGRSLLFDGSNDYFSVPGSDDFAFGTNDFTIELWVYTTTTSNTARIIQHNNNSAGSGYGNFLIYRNSATIQFYSSTGQGSWNNVNAASISDITINTWTHYAVVRINGTITTYKNGTLITSTSGAANLTDNGNLVVGTYDSGSGEFFSGYMNDIRIYKGVGKYTGNFTPPTQMYLS